MNEIIFGGRFQPFHNGHFFTLKYLSENYDRVIMGLVFVPDIFGYEDLKGSTLSPAKNPLTFLERFEIITEVLKNNSIKNVIIFPLIPYLSSGIFKTFSSFLPQKRRWFVAINSSEEKEQVEKFYKKIGDDIVAEVFQKQNEFPGKVIRRNILESKSWKHLVPIEVYNYLQKINIKERLQKLYEQFGDEIYSNETTKIIDFEKLLKDKISNKI